MNSLYKDNGPCQACGKRELPVPGLKNYRGVDPCLGCLPNVTQACCGHGGICEPYVVIVYRANVAPGTMMTEYSGGHRTLRGSKALEYFRSQGVGPCI